MPHSKDIELKEKGSVCAISDKNNALTDYNVGENSLIKEARSVLDDYYGNDKEAFVQEFSTNKTVRLPVIEFVEKKNPMCHFSQRQMHYTDLPSLMAVLKIEHLSQSNQKKLAVFLKNTAMFFQNIR